MHSGNNAHSVAGLLHIIPGKFEAAAVDCGRLALCSAITTSLSDGSYGHHGGKAWLLQLGCQLASDCKAHGVR